MIRDKHSTETGQVLIKRNENAFMSSFAIVNKSISNLQNDIQHYLHADELMLFNTMKYEKRQHSYLLGRMASKLAVSKLLSGSAELRSFAIGQGVFGYPVVNHLTKSNIQVTLTHCDSTGVAMAFPEEHPLGIDLEKIKENIISTMEDSLTDNEKTLLATYTMPQNRAYTLFWTLKESLSKILKTGLMLDFKIMEVEQMIEKQGFYLTTFKHFPQYRAVSWLVGGQYAFSVVLPRNSKADFLRLKNGLCTPLTLVK